MNRLLLKKTANLDEARIALAKLQPHLPMPRIAEQMDTASISVPKIGGDSTAFPRLEHPLALVANLGPYIGRHMPEAWKPALAAHQLHQRRKTQWLRSNARSLYAAPSEFRQTDGVVAGLLLLSLRPEPGDLRSVLMERAATPKGWGAYLAAQGAVIQGEEKYLLESIANDPRLTAALWQINANLATPLVPVAMDRCDLWSATIALNQAQAGPWLGRVVSQAATSEAAAMTALTLQPTAISEMKDAWINRLQCGNPSCACMAVRWTRFTWPTANWQALRDQLRATGISDRGSSWFHWHRDNEAEKIDEALREDNIEVLWMAELVHHAQNYGQELRRQMVTRLRTSSADTEARYVLRWLNSRGRPCT